MNPVRQRTLRDEVADQLRDAIRSGRIPVGTRLVEKELAGRFGVSRVPVREAIQSLVDQGLVQKTPRYGAYVYLPTRAEIDEISSLRVVLECFVVERVIAHWQPAHESQLRQIVAKMRTAAEAGDYGRLFRQDGRFHYLLWEIAAHTIVAEILAGLRARINRFLYEANTLLPSQELTQHVDAHERLIQVIAGGDIDAAQRETARHVLGAKERILNHFTFPATTASTGDAGPG